MKPCRVIWITDEFPPEVGGTGAIAYQLSNGLAQQGLDVQVITRQTVPPSPWQERCGVVPVRRLPPAGLLKGAGWRALPLLMRYVVRLARLLMREAPQFDLVIVSGMKIIPLAAVPVCRMLGKKTIVRIESPFEILQPISSESLNTMHGPVGRLLQHALKRLQAAVLRRATCVVAISTEIAALLTRPELRHERVVKIPNAVDVERFKPVSAAAKAALRAQLGMPASKSVLVNVGRVTRSKGMLTLIAAWSEIVARYDDVLLVVLGGGRGYWDDCEDEVIEYIRTHRLQGHVQLVGPSDRVHEYLQGADLFVSPSEYEGFALTLLEALSCALPVVTTTVGEAAYVVREGRTGFLCPPKDVQALKASLEAALERRAEWPEMGREARESVRQFDLTRVSERYAELCCELVGSGAVR
ncbi:MAG TPA: glycosyltransferase family 4 protein [Steroidobacteraceae bacterium]|nr:glycosyltransferase family 4 protein [Steroidobacteraceae bacterium]